MLNNPKTTIAGYFLLGAAVLTVVAHMMTGAGITGDLPALIAALAGVGLVAARDGGH